jgi:hypothetical protein
LSLLESLNISLVNLTAGSPYYNPHVQRPALYPPSDGYAPPEDPLVGVARQMNAARELKRRFPNLLFVGTAYSYLQDFLPHVAQAALRDGWVDCVGLGRMRRRGARCSTNGFAGRSAIAPRLRGTDCLRVVIRWTRITRTPRQGCSWWR